MQWDSARLVDKALVYAERAKESERSDPLYALWSSFALELLARACLAKIHPSLLAEPRDAQNILFGFGVARSDNKPAISVPAKTVYSRCRALVPGFDAHAEGHCQTMAALRNVELHTAEAAFESTTHNRWVPEQYRVISILASFLESSVLDFFDQNEIDDLVERQEKITKEVEGRARAAIATAQRAFQSVTEEERTSRSAQDVYKVARKKVSVAAPTSCPACRNRALLIGEKPVSSRVKLEDGELVELEEYRSSSLICPSCELSLPRDALIAVEIPTTFVIKSIADPVDHFGIDVSDYLDDERMIEVLTHKGYHVVSEEDDYAND